MNTLHKLQNQFTEAISCYRQPGNDVSADKCDIEMALVAGTLPANRRLNIYRNNVVISLRDALKAVYPVIYKLVGDEFFTAMARDYIVKFPSRSGNLHDFGNHLADFIAGFTPVGELVYLADVAKLEWAYHRVFHAKNGRPFVIEKLQRIGTADYGNLCFTLSPACRLIQSPYPILRIWQANQEPVENPEYAPGLSDTISLEEGETFVLVLRQGLDIEFHLLSPCEFNFLEAFSQHKTFFAACDRASQANPACDVGQFLQKHILSQTITDFSVAS